jgi:hypothetical protein
MIPVYQQYFPRILDLTTKIRVYIQTPSIPTHDPISLVVSHKFGSVGSTLQNTYRNIPTLYQ